MEKEKAAEKNTPQKKDIRKKKNKFQKEDVKFLNDMGAELGMQGLHKEAVSSLKKGLRLEPENSRLWFNLALSLYALNQIDDCIYALTQSLKTDVKQADAWDLLGLIFQSKGNFQESKRVYSKALKLEPENGRIWNNYGTLLFAHKKYKEARRAFESAIFLCPDLGDAVFNLRDTYTELGENELVQKCGEILKQMDYKE